jgi:hypothetical protein
MRIIQCRNVDFAFLHQPIICDHYGADRTEDDRVACHKVQESYRVREDLPRADGPTSDNSTKNLTATNVDILANGNRGYE